MPQLDKVSYFTQFFWLCFFYLGFYILLVKFFLPKVTRILKVREKKALVSSAQGKSMYDQEKHEVQTQTQQTLLQGMRQSREALQGSFQSTAQWFAESTKTTNAQQFKEMNVQYKKQMTQMTHDLMTTLHHLKSVFPPTAQAACGFSTHVEEKRRKFFHARLLASLFALQTKGKKKRLKKVSKK